MKRSLIAFLIAVVYSGSVYSQAKVVDASDADRDPVIAAQNLQNRYEQTFNKKCKIVFDAVKGQENLFPQTSKDAKNWSKADYTKKYGDLNDVWSDQKIKFNLKLAAFKKETDAAKRKTMWGEIDQLLYFMDKSCDHFKLEFDRQKQIATEKKGSFVDSVKSFF